MQYLVLEVYMNLQQLIEIKEQIDVAMTKTNNLLELEQLMRAQICVMNSITYKAKQLIELEGKKVA